MAIIGRSFPDILLDRIVSALTAFRDQQVAEADSGGFAAVGFYVKRDRVRPPEGSSEMPLVNVWQDGVEPQDGSSSGRTTVFETSRINVDCYARGIDTDGDQLDDETAMSRLYYLQEQVKSALFSLVNADFNFPSGTIGRKRWPRWSLFQNDLKLPEGEVVAGRWALEIEYNWTPEDIEGVSLSEIRVITSRWSAAYNYEEG